jgi:hypothetical protein
MTQEMSNPFISSQRVKGFGNINVPNPIYNAQGQYNPAIGKAASNYSKSAMDAVGMYMERRGLKDSSYLPVAMEQAYRGGFERSVGDFFNQQQMYGGLAQQQMGMMANAGMMNEDPSRMQQGLSGAMMGASFGSMIPGIGTGVGAGIGAAAGLLGLTKGIF